MIRITNLTIPFETDEPLKLLAARRLHIAPTEISEIFVVRKALDSRQYRGAPIVYVYTLDVSVNGREKNILRRFGSDKHIGLTPLAAPSIDWEKLSLHGNYRPVVVGFGPAGMFAALALAKAGCSPLVLERGADVENRTKAVNNFWSGGQLSPNNNAQFGEGGAGTFSDGKLTYRGDDPLGQEVIQSFIDAGAPPEIAYLAKPHIGTDKLKDVVKNLRTKIQALGGEIRFNAQVTDWEICHGQISALIVEGAERIPCDQVFLAVGHSARDTYRTLYEKKVAMEAKPFAVGVRIEHPQAFIDRAQHKEAAISGKLPPADYRLTYTDKRTGRSCYSFCMCPGGQVVAATSAPGEVVVNGMSCFARNSGVANAALVVSVSPVDFPGGALAGILFQEQIERKAFYLGGGNYFAPVQTVGDFWSNRTGSRNFALPPSYKPGVTPTNLREILPSAVTETLAEALPEFERKIPGFAAKDIPLIGAETRTSSPCRILRDRQTFESLNTKGLYPIGEGAGYAGGIMSSAIDGLRAALAVLKRQK